jgi:hypothetical protein
MFTNILIGLLFWALAVYMIHRRGEDPSRWSVGWVEALIIGLAVAIIAAPLMEGASTTGMKTMIAISAGLSLAALTAVVVRLLK